MSFPHPHPPKTHERVHAERDEVAQLWRCRRCGKWSHAQRMPKTHERWARDRHEVDDLPMLREVPAQYDHLNGFTAPGYVVVECGPFERWAAKRIEVDQQ